MDNRDTNYWNEFEYSKYKLFLKQDKLNAIISVLNRKIEFDALPPLSVELHLTDNCNLNCSWCTDKKIRKNRTTLSKETVFRLLAFFARNSVGVTVEGGGEPTIHPDFEEIIRHGHASGVHLGLITNGVRNVADLIRHFKWARISLDSSNPEEYKNEKGADRFDTVLGNLKEYAKSRDPRETHLGIGYVLTNRTVNTVMNVLPLLDEIGVDYVYLRPVEEAPELMPQLDDLFRLKKELISFTKTSRIRTLLSINDRLIFDNDNLPCVAHSLTCVVQANGDVVMCEKRRHDGIYLGNVNKDSFADIWNSDIRRTASQKLLDPAAQKGCAVCRLTAFNQIFCDINEIHTKNFI